MLGLALAACDGGEPMDAGVDAGPPEEIDAGTDAGGMDAGTDAGAPDAGAPDAGPGAPPALFGISSAGGAPFGWLDLSTLTTDRAPDLLLWDLSGNEAQSMATRDGNLIVATDAADAPVMIWDDPRGAAADAMPDTTVDGTPFGGGIASMQTFATDADDLWLVAGFTAWRLVDGLTGGRTAVSFTIADVPTATVLDPVGDTLFTCPDGVSIVAYEQASMATGTGNTSTWTFDATARAREMVVAADRLFVGLRTGSAGGATLLVWDGVSSLSGPAMATPDEVITTTAQFAGYSSFFVTADDALVGVYEPGLPGGAGGGAPPVELHVYAGASTLTEMTVANVISDPSFAGMHDIVVSNAGTLYGPADVGIVVVPNVTAPAPGTPFSLSTDADQVRVVE